MLCPHQKNIVDVNNVCKYSNSINVSTITFIGSSVSYDDWVDDWVDSVRTPFNVLQCFFVCNLDPDIGNLNRWDYHLYSMNNFSPNLSPWYTACLLYHDRDAHESFFRPSSQHRRQGVNASFRLSDQGQNQQPETKTTSYVSDKERAQWAREYYKIHQLVGSCRLRSPSKLCDHCCIMRAPHKRSRVTVNKTSAVISTLYIYMSWCDDDVLRLFGTRAGCSSDHMVLLSLVVVTSIRLPWFPIYDNIH